MTSIEPVCRGRDTNTAIPSKDAPLESLFPLYLSSLNDRELKAYYIAKDHLGMSFTMERSNGFREWKKNYDAEQQIGTASENNA